MKWQNKAFILRQLSRLPMGKKVYLTLQKLAGSNRAQPVRDFARIIELLEMIDQAGQSAHGGTFYEIGSGWHPYAPLGCFLAGAEKIITVDVNPWMSLKSAKECIIASKEHLSRFAQSMGLDKADVAKRYQQIDLDAKTLDQFLASMHTEYHCPGDACATGLKADSIDFVISSNVLEHIPASILSAISDESYRILSPGGLFVHRFNPGDHYANDDSSITTVNFLQYSEEVSDKYNQGLAYHNRMRCPEYSQIFSDSGFESLNENQRIDPVALEALEKKIVVPHSDFAKFSLEDLAADYVWYTGIKPAAIAEATNSACENKISS